MLFYRGREFIVDQNGVAVANAKLSFYLTTTTTPAPVYQNAALTITHTQPVRSDDYGFVAPIYFDPAVSYKCVIANANDVALPDGTVDPISFSVLYGLDADDIGLITNVRTEGEITAGKTPVNYSYEAGNVQRFQKNTVPGTTDMATAFQAAIDAADNQRPNVKFTDQCVISKPLLIRSSSVECLSLIGEARTISIIEPAAIDIKQPAQNINALIINQANNGHLHLSHLRFYSTVAYTGQIMYSVENGCADGSGQNAFSMVVEDCWHSLSSTNSGYYRGGFSNLKCHDNVYENSKDACWILEGIGLGDLQFRGDQVFICYDSYIRATDANLKALITVSDLNAYSHFRGRLIDINAGRTLTFSNITLEPDATSVNPGLGDVGLLRLSNCTNVMGSNLSMVARTDVPPGAVYMEFSGLFDGKFANCSGTAAIGLKIPNAAPDATATALELELTSVNLSGTAAAPVATACAQLGTGSGNFRTRGSRFNNGAGSLVVSTAAGSWSWYSDGDEFLNAGFGGAGFYCLDLNTSGTVVLRNARIGRESGSALASYYLNCNGSGTVTLINPTFVGVSPIGIANPAGSQAITIIGITGITTVAYSAAMDINAIAGDQFIITATNNTAFTINDPTNSFRGMHFTVRIRNTSGGALGAVTWSTAYKMTAWTSPATGFSRSVDFKYNGAVWVEAGRTADVPN